MDIKEESVPYKLLCNACLCVGRKLYNITDQKMQKYYLNALDEIPVSLFFFILFRAQNHYLLVIFF